MNKTISIIIICFTITLISGCSRIKAIAKLYNKNVESQEYFYGDKSIIFVPLIHFGQRTFYNSLTDSIKKWKSDGYTIFYEQIISKGIDSTKLNLCKLKWRKINGSYSNTREDYAKLEEVFKNKIVQPEYSQLGIDSTDVNADVRFDELIDKYEMIYGEVSIDSCDYSTPLDSNYHCNEGLKHDLNPIVVEYRNEELSERIIKTDLTKIVVVYGMLHIKGVKKILKQKQALTRGKKHGADSANNHLINCKAG